MECEALRESREFPELVKEMLLAIAYLSAEDHIELYLQGFTKIKSTAEALNEAMNQEAGEKAAQAWYAVDTTKVTQLPCPATDSETDSEPEYVEPVKTPSSIPNFWRIKRLHLSNHKRRLPRKYLKPSEKGNNAHVAVKMRNSAGGPAARTSQFAKSQSLKATRESRVMDMDELAAELAAAAETGEEFRGLDSTLEPDPQFTGMNVTLNPKSI